MRVLIIDDEEMIRSLATRVLNRAAIEVCTAGTGAEGLALCQSDPTIYLAIVDMTLPDIEGLDLIRRIREHRPGLRCVLSTGQGLTEQDLPAEFGGSVGLLPKPYRSQALVELAQESTGERIPEPRPAH